MTTTESLNLNSLVSSLPAHSLNPNAEKALLDNFKAAALSITTLYRSSRHASKRAYNAGYAAACRDLMEMLQLGVSDSHTLVPGETGMTIGRVMDWVEARLEAVRAREEEEDEEDERERGAQAAPAPSNPTATAAGSAARKASPSPPPPSRVVPPSSPRPSIPLKSARAAPQPKATTSAAAAIPVAPTVDFHVPITFPFVENVPPLVTGSKRRHAAMIMPPPTGTFSAQSTPPSSSSSSTPAQRRRTRSMRGLLPHNHGHGQIVDGSMMDVEEDGRERKRVARR